MRLRILIYFLFLTNICLSQDQLTLSVGQYHAGKRARLDFKKDLKPKLSINAGLNYHINNINEFDSRTYAFLYRFKANNAKERFAVNLGLQTLLYKNENIKFSIGCDFMLSKLSVQMTYFDFYQQIDSLSTSNEGYVFYHKYDRSGIWNFQSTMFVASDIKISNHIGLRLEIGTGPTFIKDRNVFEDINGVQTPVYLPPTTAWSMDSPFSPYVNLGLSYSFHKKPKESDSND